MMRNTLAFAHDDDKNVTISLVIRQLLYVNESIIRHRHRDSQCRCFFILAFIETDNPDSQPRGVGKGVM